MTKKVVILGAGIAGLAAGWFLMQKEDPNIEMAILENSSRSGGWIQSLQRDGFLFEQGPRSFRSAGIGKETWQLIEQLDLQNQIIPSHPDASTRFIYYHQQLQPLPRHLWSMPFSPLTKGWFKVLLREFFTEKGNSNEESVHEFFSRRFSSEWADRLVDPFVSGIFAGDTHELSFKSCFPSLYQLEQQYGSLIKGALLHKKESGLSIPVQAPFFSFRNGMQTITDTLYQRLEPHVFLNASVKRIILHADHVQIELANSEWLEADHLICAIPAYQLAALLSPTHPYFAAAMNKLNYASVMVVNLGYWKSVLKQKGYGYLVPSRENESILGCVWDSCVFPQQSPGREATRLTVMLGGARQSAIEEWSQEKALALALSSLEKHLNIQAIPDAIAIKMAYRSIPQYELGYQLWAAGLEEQLVFLSPSTSCIGSAFNGISVNECIIGAHQAVKKLQSSAIVCH